MFIVGKSFFSETLSKFNTKPIALLCIIHIPETMLAVGPLENNKLFWPTWIGKLYDFHCPNEYRSLKLCSSFCYFRVLDFFFSSSNNPEQLHKLFHLLFQTQDQLV